MITGSAESHGTAGDSRTNADGLSFPPWTMAVTLRMGGKNELALKASSYARLLSFLALQWERIRLWVCVPVWNNVGDSKKRASEDSLRSRIPGIPLRPPLSHILSDSSSFHLQSLRFPTAANARPISIHHAFIHFLRSHSSVLQSKPSSGSAGNSVERWRKAKRNSVDQHLR